MDAFLDLEIMLASHEGSELIYCSEELDMMPICVREAACVSAIQRNEMPPRCGEVSKKMRISSAWTRRLLPHDESISAEANVETMDPTNRSIFEDLDIFSAYDRSRVMRQLTTRTLSAVSDGGKAEEREERLLDSTKSNSNRNDGNDDVTVRAEDDHVDETKQHVESEMKRLMESDHSAKERIDACVAVLKDRSTRPAFDVCCRIMAKHTRSMGEDFLLSLCEEYLTKDTSPQNASHFVHAMLLPVIKELQRPASRTLYYAVAAAVKTHPNPVITSLFVPLLSISCGNGVVSESDKSRAISSAGSRAQGELLKRVVREHMIPSTVVVLLERLAKTGWTEVAIAVVQSILKRKLPIADSLADEIVARFEVESQNAEVAKSLKFAASVHTFTKNYGPQAAARATSLRRTLGRCKALMASVAAKALDRAVRMAAAKNGGG